MPYPASSTGGAPYGGPVSNSAGPTVLAGSRQRSTNERPARTKKPTVAKPKRPKKQPAPKPQVIPYGRQPVTEGSTLTNNQLDRAANAAVVTQYGPQDLQIQQAYGQSDRMMEQAPQWWQDYVNQVGQFGAQDAAAWQNATNQIANIGGTMANAAAQASQADQAAMAADAANRGATVDPAAATRAMQAAQVNTSLMGNQANLATLLGANQGSYFRGQQNIGARQKVQSRLDELNYRRNQIDPQAASLAQQKGAYKTQYKTDTLSNEQKNVLERMVFGQDVAKNQTDAALKAAALKQQSARDRRAARIAQQKLAQQQQENRVDNARADRQVQIAQQNADANTTRANKPTGSGKDRFGNTPKQRRAAQDSYSRANIMARPLPKNADVQTIAGFLVSKNVNPVIARAVAQMKVNGYVDAKTARQLAKRGIRQGFTTKRPKAPSAKFPTISNGGVAAP